MDLKPIETIYNGNRFRSRLEARWAVFFDAVGVEYQYEPEGFEFHDGTMYLPDFYLPVNDMYIEIKPVGAFQINGETLVNGRENNFKYVIAKSEIEDAGKHYSLITGTPFDVQDEKKNSSFVWGSFPVLIYSVCQTHKSEAEFASFIRFEHGESLDDYAHKIAKEKVHAMNARGRIEAGVLGIALFHPHFWMYSDQVYHIVQFKTYCSKELERIMWALNGAVCDGTKCEKSEAYDNRVRRQIRDSLSITDKAVFDVLLEDRQELSVNDIETFNAYLHEWLRRHNDEQNKYSLSAILERRRRDITNVEI